MKLNDNYDNLEAFEAEIEKRGFTDKWEQFYKEGMNGFTWDSLREWEEIFKPFGLSFDWCMGAEPFDFELISV